MNESPESESVQRKKHSKKFFNLRTLLVVLFGFIFIGTATSAAYFYWQYRQLSKNQVTSEKEIAQMVETVGKLMELPADESPNLATVTDIEKIKDQPFFARSQNGDKVLFYLKWGKAIMYRPSTHKIIDVTEIKATPKTEVEPTVMPLE